MTKRQSHYLLLFVMSTLLLILVVSAGAQSSVVPTLNPDPAVVAYNGYAGDGLPSPQSLDTITISTWSRVAYEKWADNNWDIYLYDSKGSQRLTTHAAVDSQPSIDRGGERVAFTSDRNGQFDLYTMNVDGTNLKKIVDGWAAFPAWSPDGETIALQLWVDGRYEIFLVDADGSNLRRLTNSSGWDIQPTWSPDSQKIAFASERSGSYAIYIMNTDAGGLRKLTTFPNSLHPTWSPDGAYIGFDADVDGDGWQEVAVINVDGSEQKEIYDPGSSATAFAGSWSPDTRFLGLIDITLIQQGGLWYWTESIIKQWGMASNSVQLLVPGDANWYMDWQTLDTTPPVTSIGPMNTYSRADFFSFTWSGTDYGGSGLKDYSVYYRNSNGGSWQTYWKNSIATAAAFLGTPGETVDFLVRPRDNAYNYGVWWKQPVKTTTFYNTVISGYIVDNTGVILSQIPLNVAPVPMFPIETNDIGYYRGYSAASGEYNLSVTQPGYLPMPQTKTTSDEDFHRILTLLPIDTRLKNGTFEESAFLPVGWQTGGGLPVVVNEKAQATGKYSISIGSTLADAVQDETAIAIGTLSQEVTIPVNMETPILAVMAKAANDLAGDGSGLEIIIKPDGGSEVVLFDSRLANFWAIYAFNITPWQGQKVDVIFRVTQDSNDTPLTVYLDDASLGSANPELWVNLNASPRAAIKGDIIKLDAAFGNRGGVNAANGKLEVTLDPAMSFISAIPPATQNGHILSWDWPTIAANSGPDMVSVVAQVNSNPGGDMKLIAEISSDTAEAHKANNTAGLFIANKTEVFMPIMGVTP